MEKLLKLLQTVYDADIETINFIEWDTRESIFKFNVSVKNHDDELLEVDDDVVIAKIHEIIEKNTVEIQITL